MRKTTGYPNDGESGNCQTSHQVFTPGGSYAPEKQKEDYGEEPSNKTLKPIEVGSQQSTSRTQVSHKKIRLVEADQRVELMHAKEGQQCHYAEEHIASDNHGRYPQGHNDQSDQDAGSNQGLRPRAGQNGALGPHSPSTLAQTHPCRSPVSYTHLRAHETKANLVCR